MPSRVLIASLLILLSAMDARAATCPSSGVHVQVLGSGGPELDDGRASSGYLVWQDGRARVLVDMGDGSLRQYEESGADLRDLDLILLSHLHVDHSADLPALLKAAYFTDRRRDLWVYGPSGNHLMPDTDDFLQALFGTRRGAYRYLDSYLDGREAFRLRPVTVAAEGRTQSQVWQRDGVVATAVPVQHGPIPALAWRVELDGVVLVFSGDMNGTSGTLEKLASGADLLIAHHAIPEGATGAARRLHMPPSVIGRIAEAAGVKRLLLSHRMRRTLGREAESEARIRASYAGPLAFVEDGQCHTP